MVIVLLRLYFDKKRHKHTVKKAKDGFDCFPAIFLFETSRRSSFQGIRLASVIMWRESDVVTVLAHLSH